MSSCIPRQNFGIVGLPEECLLHISSYLHIGEATRLFSCCRHLSTFSASPYYWDAKLSRAMAPSISNKDVRIEFRAAGNKSSAKDVLKTLLTALPNECHNLAYNVIESSSTDRPVEKASNVLTSSLCQKFHFTNLKNAKFAESLSEYMMDFQWRSCKCGQNKPCYWSSKPSTSDNIYESITFLSTSTLSVIYGFSLSPYQAFWHPDSPIYAPREACIELLLPVETPNTSLSSSESQSTQVSYYIYYQSPFFQVKPEFREQSFLLDRPVFCFGGLIRLALRGMQQRQTLVIEGHDEGHPLDSYYVCLNRAALIGHCFQGKVEYEFSALNVAGRKTTHTCLSSSSKAHALISAFRKGGGEANVDINDKNYVGGGSAATNNAPEVKMPSTSAYCIPVLNSDSSCTSDPGSSSSNNSIAAAGGGGGGDATPDSHRSGDSTPGSGRYEVDKSRYQLSLSLKEANTSTISLVDCISAAQGKYGNMSVKQLLESVKEMGVDKNDAVEKDDIVKLLVKTDAARQVAVLKEAQNASCRFGPPISYLNNTCLLDNEDKAAVKRHGDFIARFLR